MKISIRNFLQLLYSAMVLMMGGGSFVNPESALAFDLDSVAIPDRVVNNDKSNAENSQLMPSTAGTQNTSDCSLVFSFNMTHGIAATYFDSSLNVTQVFVTDGAQVLRHDIDSTLNRVTTPLPVSPALVWAAADLDLDGNVELVLQRGDGTNGFLDIHSAPTWEQRSRTVFPGMNVYFHASAVNIDDDPFLEVHAVPHTLGFVGRVVIIQYDAETDSFIVTDDIESPSGTTGSSAVADFDDDGRMEIITGSDDFGHMLYEYDSGLSVIGPVGTYYSGMNRSAVATRPKPDGIINALIGHSSTQYGYLYQLLKATSDNVFSIVTVFQEATGWHGRHPCVAMDSDCDGMDELLLKFFPLFRIWEWNETAGAFIQGCTWDSDDYGTFTAYHHIDLNQDGIAEWGTVDHNDRFQVFAEEFCATSESGLVSWWPLDEESGELATDVWGNNDGSWKGTPTPSLGFVDGSLKLDGLSDFVAVADADSLSVHTGDLSIEAWMNSSVSPTVNPIMSKYDAGASRGFAFSVGDGDKLALQLADGSVSSYAASSLGTIADGLWHHAAVSVDRDDVNGVRFYLDGAPIGSADPTDRPGSLSNDADLMLGAWSSTSGDTTFFEGTLDEVSFYKRALDSTEIRCIYLASDRGKCQPDTSCNCPAQGDIEPDGFLTSLDLAAIIDALFVEGPNPQDIYCPTYRFDLDCDFFTTALDLSIIIDHLFVSGPDPCEPCPP
jgi:hypothetical protein